MKFFAILLISMIQLSCSHKLNKSQSSFHQPAVQFSGYRWIISASGKPQAPGPNFWSAKNVWVDKNGYMHLKLSKDANGIWSCAEVRTELSLGSGKYEFWVESELDKLDQNIIFGMFSYSGRDQHDEVDIEISKWGNNNHNNLHYTVYPKKGKKQQWNTSGQLTLNGSYSTHIYTRSDKTVQFESMHGFQGTSNQSIFSAICENAKIISTEPMPVFMNLWLFNGQIPVNKNEVEIIIHKFSFTPQ